MNLEQQVKEFNDIWNNDYHDDKNGNNKGSKEEELSSGKNSLPFINNLNLDHQNREKIEDLFRKEHEGHGYLDLWKGFWKEEYTYDPNGNINKKQNGWGEINYQYNQANQLQKAGNKVYQYDPNGNLVQEVLGKYKIDYSYNYENRLIKANSQFKHHFSHWPVKGEVSFGYDALGRMVRKEVEPVYGSKNEVEYYIYNGLGLDILADYQYETKQYGWYKKAGKLEPIKEYYYGNGILLASKEFDDPFKNYWDRDPLKDVTFYHQDALGSVVMLTDRNGQVEERYQYDVWGKVYDGRFEDGFPGCGQSDNVYGFTGQRYQTEIGVYSFPYRDYRPKAMRWLTEDPIKDGWNWYQYCGSDPINFVDLDGLMGKAVADAGRQVMSAPHPAAKVVGAIIVGIGIGIMWVEGTKDKSDDKADKYDEYDDDSYYENSDRLRSTDSKRHEKRQVDDAWGKDRAAREKASKELHDDKKGEPNDKNKSYKDLKNYGC